MEAKFRCLYYRVAHHITKLFKIIDNWQLQLNAAGVSSRKFPDADWQDFVVKLNRWPAWESQRWNTVCAWRKYKYLLKAARLISFYNSNSKIFFSKLSQYKIRFFITNTGPWYTSYTIEQNRLVASSVVQMSTPSIYKFMLSTEWLYQSFLKKKIADNCTFINFNKAYIIPLQ